MSSDVKFVEGRGGVGGRHDAELVKDFLQSREAAVLQESTKQCCREGGRRGVVVQGQRKEMCFVAV